MPTMMCAPCWNENLILSLNFHQSYEFQSKQKKTYPYSLQRQGILRPKTFFPPPEARAVIMGKKFIWKYWLWPASVSQFLWQWHSGSENGGDNFKTSLELRQKLIHFQPMFCFVGFRMTIIWGGENILVCVRLSRRLYHDEGWETRQGNAAAVTQIDAGKMWEPGSRQKCETLCRKSRNQREVKLRPSGLCTLKMCHEKVSRKIQKPVVKALPLWPSLDVICLIEIMSTNNLTGGPKSCET